MADDRPWSVKAADFNKLDGDIKAVLEQLDAYQAVDSRGFDALGSLQGGPSFASSGVGRMVAGMGKSLIAPPEIYPTPSQVAELHDAVTSGKSLAVSVKAAVAESDAPMGARSQYVLPPTVLRREPQRILALVPTFAMDTSVITYYQESSASNAATAVAEGDPKPEATVAYTAVNVSATKIATYKGVTDEALADYGQFLQVVQNRLTLDVIDAENSVLLNATAAGANSFAGLLNTSGIITRAKAAEPNNLDVLSEAFDDLRLGASFVEPDGIVMHPTDWGALRRLKDSQGRYYLAPQPNNAAALELWGVPVKLTSTIAQGTALVGSFAEACAVGVRDGLRVEVGTDGSDFVNNTRKIRAEERLALMVPRPSALVKVTGL